MNYTTAKASIIFLAATAMLESGCANFEETVSRANEGDSSAQYSLYKAYSSGDFRGQEVGKNRQLALDYLAKAAKSDGGNKKYRQELLNCYMRDGRLDKMDEIIAGYRKTLGENKSGDIIISPDEVSDLRELSIPYVETILQQPHSTMQEMGKVIDKATRFNKFVQQTLGYADTASYRNDPPDYNNYRNSQGFVDTRAYQNAYSAHKAIERGSEQRASEFGLSGYLGIESYKCLTAIQEAIDPLKNVYDRMVAEEARRQEAERREKEKLAAERRREEERQRQEAEAQQARQRQEEQKRKEQEAERLAKQKEQEEEDEWWNSVSSDERIKKAKQSLPARTFMGIWLGEDEFGNYLKDVISDIKTVSEREKWEDGYLVWVEFWKQWQPVFRRYYEALGIDSDWTVDKFSFASLNSRVYEQSLDELRNGSAYRFLLEKPKNKFRMFGDTFVVYVSKKSRTRFGFDVRTESDFANCADKNAEYEACKNAIARKLGVNPIEIGNSDFERESIFKWQELEISLRWVKEYETLGFVKELKAEYLLILVFHVPSRTLAIQERESELSESADVL